MSPGLKVISISDVNENENLPKTAEFIKCEEEKIDEDPLSRERCAAQCSLMPRAMCAHLLANIFHNVYYLVTGLQKLCNPGWENTNLENMENMENIIQMT